MSGATYWERQRALRSNLSYFTHRQIDSPETRNMKILDTSICLLFCGLSLLFFPEFYKNQKPEEFKVGQHGRSLDSRSKEEYQEEVAYWQRNKNDFRWDALYTFGPLVLSCLAAYYTGRSIIQPIEEADKQLQKNPAQLVKQIQLAIIMGTALLFLGPTILGTLSLANNLHEGVLKTLVFGIGPYIAGIYRGTMILDQQCLDPKQESRTDNCG